MTGAPSAELPSSPAETPADPTTPAGRGGGNLCSGVRNLRGGLGDLPGALRKRPARAPQRRTGAAYVPTSPQNVRGAVRWRADRLGTWPARLRNRGGARGKGGGAPLQRNGTAAGTGGTAAGKSGAAASTLRMAAGRCAAAAGRFPTAAGPCATATGTIRTAADRRRAATDRTVRRLPPSRQPLARRVPSSGPDGGGTGRRRTCPLGPGRGASRFCAAEVPADSVLWVLRAMMGGSADQRPCHAGLPEVTCRREEV